MTQRYFVNETGQYLGSYDGPDGEIPEGLSVGEEVSHAPEHASQVWDFDQGQFSPSPPQIEDYQVAIQSLVDETARAKQFNDGVTLASYIKSTVEPWAAQAQAFVAWRDEVWQYAYSELAKFQSGEREQPTIEAFRLELPAIIWP